MQQHILRQVALSAILGALAGAVVLGLQGSGAAAQEPAVVINGEFAPPEGLKAFKAMTFVVDLAPGVSVPLHSHPGRSQLLLLDGEVTVQDPGGKETVHRKGDVWMEEVNEVLGGRNSGKETARLVWTILLPEGAELEVPYKQ